MTSTTVFFGEEGEGEGGGRRNSDSIGNLEKWREFEHDKPIDISRILYSRLSQQCSYR